MFGEGRMVKKYFPKMILTERSPFDKHTLTWIYLPVPERTPGQSGVLSPPAGDTRQGFKLPFRVHHRGPPILSSYTHKTNFSSPCYPTIVKQG